MSFKRSVTTAVMWVAAEGGVSTLLSVISLFVMAHFVGPVAVGVAVLAHGIVRIVNLGVEFLFQDALVQREVLTAEHEHTACTIAVLLGILAFGLLVLAGGPLAALFGEPDLKPVLLASAATLPFTGLISVPTAQLRRQLQFRVLVIRTMISRLAGAVIGPVLAILGFGPWSFIAQHIAAVVISTILILASAAYRPRLYVSWARFRELIAFALPTATNGIAMSIQSKLFPVLVGLYQGTTAVGFINMAFRTAETARDLLAEAIHSIALSVFSRQQGELPSLQQSLHLSTRIIGLATQPIFAGIAIAANDFVPLVLGQAWLPIVPLVQILAAASMVRFLVFQNEMVAMALGKPVLLTLASSFSLAVVMGSMVILQPETIVQSIVIWVAPQLCIVPFWLIAIRRLTRWGAWTQIRPGLPPFFCAALMALGVIAAEATLFPEMAAGPALAAKILCGVLGYLLLTLLFNRSVIFDLIGFVRLGARRGHHQPGLPARVPEST